MSSTTSRQVIAGLQRTPLLSISEMRAALDADRAAHGIYAWWLINSEALPAVPTTDHPVEPVGLIYVGIGPGRASSRRVLRARFGDHGKDAGRSTLRRALASLLYQREGWQLQWTDRPLLADEDNETLTAWMDANLRVQWVRVSEPWGIEAEIVRRMRPPLNRTHNQAHPFYKEVGEARERFRAAALATVVSDSGQRDDGVKHLTTGNWLEPDPICLKFVEVNLATAARRPPTGEGWAERFLAVDLAPTVAGEVRDMWEAARGLLLYGWFYYAIYAIGEHELRRVADAAVLHRYQQAGGPPNKKRGPEGELRWPDMMRRVDWLIEAGVIPAGKHARWDGIRDLRNETTHISIRHLTDPYDVLRVLELLAGEIDALFAA